MFNVNKFDYRFRVSVLRPEHRPYAYYTENNQAEQFRKEQIERLEIDYSNIPPTTLHILVYEQVVAGQNSMSYDYAQQAMLYRKKSFGQLSMEWVLNVRRWATKDILLGPNGLLQFRICSIGRLRMLVLLDDIFYTKDSAYFQGNECNYCLRKKCHMTWTCPLFPTEQMRYQWCDIHNACLGCGIQGCTKERTFHGPNPDFKYCSSCPTDKTHAGWRCKSPARMSQLKDVTNRYTASWIATKDWTDAHIWNFLKQLCDEFMLPYPHGIQDV